MNTLIKTNKKLFSAILLLLAVILIQSCKKDDVYVNQDAGGAGSFVAVNITRNDSVIVSGELNSKSEILKVYNDDKVKIYFKAKEEYEKYKFNTKYVIDNDIVIKDEQFYEFTFPQSSSSYHKIDFSATYEENTNQNSIHITASGTIILLEQK